jgi:hypothetical protein
MNEFNAEKKFKCTACGGRLSPSFVQWPRDPNRAASPSPTLCNKCCPRITIEVVFLTRSGAAGGIDALRTAGYDVLVGDHLADPESAETVFIEVYGVYGRFNRRNVDIEAFFNAMNSLASLFNGEVIKVGLQFPETRRATQRQMEAELMFDDLNNRDLTIAELTSRGFDVEILKGVVKVRGTAKFGLTPAVDAFWHDVERIVKPFGGGADCCGLVNDDDVPFRNFR